MVRIHAMGLRCSHGPILLWFPCLSFYNLLAIEYHPRQKIGIKKYANISSCPVEGG